MAKVKVCLAMLVRMTKDVVVEVPDDFFDMSEEKKDELLRNVYQADEGADFTEDMDWGCEEGTHIIKGRAPDDEPAQFRVTDAEYMTVN